MNVKCVYTWKADEQGLIVKAKSRLVAGGFKQREGIDFGEIFAPTTGIFKIEDGAFFEDQATHEIVRERCPNISSRKYLGGSGKHRYDFQRERPYARMRMNTSQSKSCAPWALSPTFHIRTSSRCFEKKSCA